MIEAVLRCNAASLLKIIAQLKMSNFNQLQKAGLMENTEYILSAKGIYKSFPGVLALENVDFFLKKGEIHALMGENGAGKSTLIKVLTGVEQPDKGSIEFDGKRIEVHSPQACPGNWHFNCVSGSKPVHQYFCC